MRPLGYQALAPVVQLAAEAASVAERLRYPAMSSPFWGWLSLRVRSNRVSATRCRTSPKPAVPPGTMTASTAPGDPACHRQRWRPDCPWPARQPSDGRPVRRALAVVIFVPTVLILVAVLAVLAGVTRWWDRRDAQRSAEMTRRVDAATGREVAVRSARIARAEAGRRWWRRRTRCTCSWHTSEWRWASRPPGNPRRTLPHRERHPRPGTARGARRGRARRAGCMTPDARVRVVTDKSRPASEVEPAIVARPDPRRQRRRPTGPLRPRPRRSALGWGRGEKISALAPQASDDMHQCSVCPGQRGGAEGTRTPDPLTARKLRAVNYRLDQQQQLRSRITGPVNRTMQPEFAPQIAPRIAGEDRLFD